MYDSTYATSLLNDILHSLRMVEYSQSLAEANVWREKACNKFLALHESLSSGLEVALPEQWRV